MSRRHILLLTALGLATPFSAHADTQSMQLHSDLSGQQELPAAQTPGSGKLEGTLDRKSQLFTYTITYQDLTGPVTAAQFHGPANPGQNAPVVVAIKSPETSPIKGSVKLDEQQAKELLANDWYVNLQTAAHSSGEIRGQVLHGGP